MCKMIYKYKAYQYSVKACSFFTSYRLFAKKVQRMDRSVDLDLSVSYPSLASMYDLDRV